MSAVIVISLAVMVGYLLVVLYLLNKPEPPDSAKTGARK